MIYLELSVIILYSKVDLHTTRCSISFPIALYMTSLSSISPLIYGILTWSVISVCDGNMLARAATNWSHLLFAFFLLPQIHFQLSERFPPSTTSLISSAPNLRLYLHIHESMDIEAGGKRARDFI